MYFADPLHFECQCGHVDKYSLASLVSLEMQCPDCGFSLRSLGRSIQQTLNRSHACSKIAVIAVELELQFMVEFDDPELEGLITVSGFSDLLAAKTATVSRDEALQVVIDKLRHHGADGIESITADTWLRDCFRLY